MLKKVLLLTLFVTIIIFFYHIHRRFPNLRTSTNQNTLHTKKLSFSYDFTEDQYFDGRTQQVTAFQIDQKLIAVQALTSAHRQGIRERYLQGKPKPDCKIHVAADPWDKLYQSVSECGLYQEQFRDLEKILDDLSHQPIDHVEFGLSGTQMKLVLIFSNGRKAVFKPQRYDIDYETGVNQFFFADFERANAEIAAFHLDRILEFRRVPPTAGRRLNLSDGLSKVPEKIKKRFFYSPSRNLCFAGICKYYCDVAHAICGSPHMIQGSVQMWVQRSHFEIRHIRSNYRRSYKRKNITAGWENGVTHAYCKKYLLAMPGLTETDRLQFIDMHIFDFLTSNLDRHHYDHIVSTDNRSLGLTVLDNGRGFGRWDVDYTNILAPLYQCCLVNPQTVQKLLVLSEANPGNRLSDLLRDSLTSDPLSPVLHEKYIKVLDRRVDVILRVIAKCVEKSQNHDWARRDFR